MVSTVKEFRIWWEMLDQNSWKVKLQMQQQYLKCQRSVYN